MRVLFPYTAAGIEPGAMEAMEAFCPVPWEPWELHEPDDYFWLLDDAWRRGEEFAVVEHDITIEASTLVSMQGCQGMWCGAYYPYLHGQYLGLGCCRFNPQLIARFPQVFDIIGELEDVTHPKRFWCAIDARLGQTLRDLGEYSRCTQHGTVGHLGIPWPSHGCGGEPPPEMLR